MDTPLIKGFIQTIMIRKKIKSEKTTVSIELPAEYLGKQLEVVVFSLEEVTSKQKNNVNPASLRGTLKLSEAEYKNFNDYLHKVRDEWSSPF